MASTFSPILRIELIGTGDQSGTWGNTTNINLGTLIEQAIAGTATIDVTAANVTLTNFNGTTDEARCAALRVVGTPGVSRNIVAPAVSKIYVVANGSDAAVVLKTSVSTGLTVPVGEVYLAYFDTTSADFRLVGRASATTNTANTLVLRDASGNFAAGTITANLTGNVTGNLTGNVTGNLLGTPLAPTAPYGTNTPQVATAAFVQAALQALYPIGTIYTAVVATNPNTLFGFGTWVAFGAGRVLVGVDAGDPLFDTVEETGGSKDAVVVSHTHAVTDPGHKHVYGKGLTQAIFGGGAGPGVQFLTTNTDTSTEVTGITIGSAGVSGTNANIQPYVAVYMWKRTA